MDVIFPKFCSLFCSLPYVNVDDAKTKESTISTSSAVSQHPFAWLSLVPNFALQSLDVMSMFRSCLARRVSLFGRIRPLSILNSQLSSNSPNETTPETPNCDSATEDFANLRLEVEKLTVANTELQDKYKRALAESDNMRKRLMRQIEEAKVFGIHNFCKDILEVADVLSTATQSVTEDLLDSQKNPSFCSLFNGLKLTEQQLMKVFERHKLVQILPKEGDRFDPNFHEAVYQVPLSQGKEANTIATITKVGYKLHERTLRPAFVGVFSSQ